MDFDWNAWLPTLASYGVKILGAFLALIIGRILIKFVVKSVNKGLERQQIEPTLIRYVSSILVVLLNIVLILAILGYFGFDTASFAALLAGAGLAIGTAWGGLLAHFAAGAFMVVLRPFKVGDFITAGGVTGTVKEIGMFVTTIEMMDNVITFVGNNKIFSDNILNFTQNPYRRVELKAQLDSTVNISEAKSKLKEALKKIANIDPSREPEVDVLDFTPMGPVLAVRPFCHNDHYWQVYFDTNQAIADVCGASGYPQPQQHLRIHGSK
jgi:small conductance mechanosensitive channel